MLPGLTVELQPRRGVLRSGGLLRKTAAQIVVAVLDQLPGLFVVREALPEPVCIFQGCLRVVGVVSQDPQSVEAVGHPLLLIPQGLEQLHGLLILALVHQLRALPDQRLPELLRAVLVVPQGLKEGGGPVVAPGAPLPGSLPVTEPGQQIAPAPKSAQGQNQQQGRHNGGVSPPVGGWGLLALGLRGGLHHDGGPDRGLRSDGGGHHGDRGGGLGIKGGSGGRGGRRSLLRRGRVQQVGVHVLLQPDPPGAAADAAQAPQGVGHPAGADPKPLPHLEIAVVPDPAGAGQVRQKLIVGVLRADGLGLEGQVAGGLRLVPGGAVGKADPLGVDLGEGRPLPGQLHRPVLPEDGPGPGGEPLHGQKLQGPQRRAVGAEAPHPQKHLADRPLRAVDHADLEQALSAFQVPGEPEAAHPHRALRQKQLLPGGGEGLKSLVNSHIGLRICGNQASETLVSDPDNSSPYYTPFRRLWQRFFSARRIFRGVPPPGLLYILLALCRSL